MKAGASRDRGVRISFSNVHGLHAGLWTCASPSLASSLWLSPLSGHLFCQSLRGTWKREKLPGNSLPSLDGRLRQLADLHPLVECLSASCTKYGIPSSGLSSPSRIENASLPTAALPCRSPQNHLPSPPRRTPAMRLMVLPKSQSFSRSPVTCSPCDPCNCPLERTRLGHLDRSPLQPSRIHCRRPRRSCPQLTAHSRLRFRRQSRSPIRPQPDPQAP